MRLEAVVLPDKRKVTVKPAAILRCTMASAIADWLRKDMVPLASSLARPSATSIISIPSNAAAATASPARCCRSTARPTPSTCAPSSWPTGSRSALTDRTMPREVRERVLHSVCARFSTVLGPGSDWYHEDHIHLDLAQRRATTTGSANGMSGIRCHGSPRCCRRNVPRKRHRARLRPSPRPSPRRSLRPSPRRGEALTRRRRKKASSACGEAGGRGQQVPAAQAGNKKAPVKPALLDVRS